MKKVVAFILLLVSGLSVKAQGDIAHNLKQILSKHAPSFLYLHSDKNIYTNNEKIWFAAYLFDTPNPIAEHKVLNVALVNEQTKNVAATQKFNIEDGLSSGFLGLPDSIPPGSYQLLAYTNVLDADRLPIASYYSPIKVLNIAQQTFSSKVQLLDTVVKNGAIRASVTINGLDPNRKSNIAVNYQIGDAFSKSLKLDKKEAVISIPEQALQSKQNILMLNVNVDGEVQYHNQLLPGKMGQPLDIKFYPEGGDLINGLQSKIGWEAKTSDGRPIALKGTLMKNNEALFDVSTNGYGMGIFNIQPEANVVYSIKLQSGQYVKENTKVALPASSGENGIVLNLPKAVVNDSLNFTISSTKAMPILVMLHNNLKDNVLLKGKVNPSIQNFNISLDKLPKGLTTLTILDELGKPLAERIFFAHYDKRSLSSTIELDKTSYAKRDSVAFKLKLVGQEGKPAKGIVSVAVVQNNRFGARTADIESYFYLNKMMQDLPTNPMGNGFLDKDYLEDILLIKGWRRYKAEDLNAENLDSTLMVDYQIMSGLVLNGKKNVKKAVDLIGFGGIKSSIISTNADGTFLLTTDNLLVEQNKEIFFRVGLAKSGYDIKINDAFIPITGTLAKKVKPTVLESLLNNQENSIVKNLQHSISLKDVEIKVNRSNIYGAVGEKGANDCGDYVDDVRPNGILNYENTPLDQRLKPIKNTAYLKRIDLNGSWFRVERVWYNGCLTEIEKNGIAIKGINSGKEYYMAVDDDGDLQNHSTLFWQSGLITNSSGEIPIRFKVGDIADDFSIIVQGISDSGLVNVKEAFKVVDKL